MEKRIQIKDPVTKEVIGTIPKGFFNSVELVDLDELEEYSK